MSRSDCEVEFAKKTLVTYTLIFSFLCPFLVSDKYVLVSIEKLSPTEYVTFCVPYSAVVCAVFGRIYHRCDIYVPSHMAILMKHFLKEISAWFSNNIYMMNNNFCSITLY